MRILGIVPIVRAIPMPNSPSSRVVVIGAGPVGLMCALFLARADVSVCVVDSGARGAGWASGGMLSGVYEGLDAGSGPVLRALAQHSLPLWHALAQQLSLPLLGPTLFVARNGLEADRLHARLDAALPNVPLPQGLIGSAAWRCDGDVALDPRATLLALRGACVAAGVAFVQGEVVRIAPEIVHLRDGRALAARKIVVATGQGGAGLQDSVPELGCIKPVKGQLLRLAGAASVLDAKIVRAGRLYLIARGADVIVGATSGGGEDLAHIDVDDQSALYQEACQLAPALAAYWPSESWAGLRPMTPDALPLLGETTERGTILACGTYRNGWLLAPVLAQAVVAIVQGGSTSSSPATAGEVAAQRTEGAFAAKNTPSVSFADSSPVGRGSKNASTSSSPATAGEVAAQRSEGASAAKNTPSVSFADSSPVGRGSTDLIGELSPSRFPNAPRRAMSGQ
jgi:glycine oxidase